AGLRSRCGPAAGRGTTMSLNRIAASTANLRSGCSVSSVMTSAVVQALTMLSRSRTARYSGSDLPAWRMNQTGVAGTGSRRHAFRNSDSSRGAVTWGSSHTVRPREPPGKHRRPAISAPSQRTEASGVPGVAPGQQPPTPDTPPRLPHPDGSPCHHRGSRVLGVRRSGAASPAAEEVAIMGPMFQPCQAWGGEQLSEQLHETPGTGPDAPDGPCPEWLCTECGAAQLTTIPPGTAGQAVLPDMAGRVA